MDALPLSALTSSDIVIAVMGITGSGKSSFISHLVNEEVAIGHDLISCTATIGIYNFIFKNTQRVYLIDTPGFDDSSRTDTDILKDVAFFLSQTYKHTMHLAGIIYLHRITDMRMSGSSLRNLNMFKKLCGEDAYKHIVLATTMWSNLNSDSLTYDVGVQREEQLITRKDWWGLMHDRGSKVVRHTGEKNSAMSIVSYLVELRSKVILNIQMEMVDQHKQLEDTAAGQEVEKELQEMKRKYQADLEELKSSYEQAQKDKDETLAEALKQQREELESKLEKANQAQEDLKISLERLSEEKTAEYTQLLAQFEREQDRTADILAARQADYDRLRDERARDAQTHSAAQQQYQKDRAAFDSRIRDMEKQHLTADAERQQAEARRLDALQADVDARFAREEERYRKREEELAAQVQQLEAARKSSASGTLIPLLSLLASLGTTFIGAATLNPTLIAGGVTVAGQSAAALGNNS